MRHRQRLVLFALAALIAVTAFVVLRPSVGDAPTVANAPAPAGQDPAADQPPDDSRQTDAGEPADATPAPVKRRKAKPPLLTADSARTLSYNKGDRIRFRVRHASPEEVHVHGYDIARDLPAGKTVTVSFPADIEGIFEVELERSGTPLGKLKVEP